MNRIYDITVTITPSLPVWPGDPVVRLERVAKIEEGANANVSQMAMSTHTGTHVDAPYHFISESDVTVEQLSLETLTGRTYVLQLPDTVDLVTADVLNGQNLPGRMERLLFRTRNSTFWHREEVTFQTSFVGLDVTAAEFLVGQGIKLVGIDYLSIAPFKQSRPTHELLLGRGVIILEGLDLIEIRQGWYDLYCLPLKLGGSDGAPVRAILVGE